MTAPLKKHTDNQTRDMVDITGVVYKSFHKGGFNILKITSGEISQSGKEYNHRMSFAKKKIDFWVSFKPDKEMAKAYDKARDEAAIRLNTRIVETGDYKKARKSVTQEKTLAERNTEILIKKHGAAIRITLEKNPKISMNKLSAKFGISYQKISAIVEQIKNTEGGV
jgi:diaminopimelate decarboxylase